MYRSLSGKQSSFNSFAMILPELPMQQTFLQKSPSQKKKGRNFIQVTILKIPQTLFRQIIPLQSFLIVAFLFCNVCEAKISIRSERMLLSMNFQLYIQRFLDICFGLFN